MKNCVYDIKLLSVLFVGLLLGQQNLYAQSPTIKTSVDKTNIIIGQQINLHIEASMPDNTYRLSWFSTPDSLDNFKVITTNKIDSTSANGNLNFSQNLLITSFDSGRQVIPPLTLSFSTLDSDSSFNMYTDSIVVNVGYSPADSTLPFHDIKNIIEVKKSFPWWAWTLVALGVLLIIIWVFFLAKFFKKKPAIPIFESKISPYEEAMQLLNDLKKEQLPEDNKTKEFYTRLTEIFKRYLSRKTNTYQLHLTTEELLIELSGLDLAKEKLAAFASCLRMGNAVKFAKYVPPAYENEKSFEETKNMIEAINSIENKKPKDGI